MKGNNKKQLWITNKKIWSNHVEHIGQKRPMGDRFLTTIRIDHWNFWFQPTGYTINDWMEHTCLCMNDIEWHRVCVWERDSYVGMSVKWEENDLVITKWMW